MTVQWLEGLGKIAEKREDQMSEEKTESIAKKARKARVTIYCAGKGDDTKFAVVTSVDEAAKVLGVDESQLG